MYLTRDALRACAGAALICGFEGQQVGPELKEILREVRPLGLILFGRNVGVAEANIGLCRELRALRPRAPLLLSIDQEGGRVARLRDGMTAWPAMRTLGTLAAQDAADGVRTARAVGAAIAAELRCVGLDLDFAPVLDVHTNPRNPIIGDRAFATEPRAVAALAAAFVEGCQGAGVAACGKHFPGHGDTSVDSHLALPFVEHELARLREVEWPPYRAAIDAGISSIMTAHLVAERLDGLPATLSATVLTQHLRRELGFAGAIISDDVDMAALAQHHDMHEVGPLGLRAGVDVFLACRDPAAMMALYRGIVVAAESGALPHATLAAAAARGRTLSQSWVRPLLPERHAAQALRALVGTHRSLAERLGQLS